MTKARDIASGGGIEAGEVVPHIIPGVLYPAVAGKLLDGSTSHSGNYGTAQADGYSYYYTDIKGSKPIKDPRIGGHFGSQRHKTRSLQILEQETATHGTDVFSVDGREWMRMYGTTTHADGPAKVRNNINGHYIDVNAGQAGTGSIEIVAYCSGLNISATTFASETVAYKYKIDDGSLSAEKTDLETSANTPLSLRYVDRGSIVNIFNDQTLGIHTIVLTGSTSADYFGLYGI